MTTFLLNQSLECFEDELPNIRAACVLNAEDIVATYSPYKELDVDQPFTKEAIHLHVNFLRVQEKLTPILNSIKRIDSYRYYKNNPVAANLITDADIEQARHADESWFIGQANLSTRKPSKGLCPFHNDSNASLTLMKSKSSGKFYLKCFACNTVVDAPGYLMKRDGIKFIDAVRRIVNK